MLFSDRTAADTRVLDDSTYFIPVDYVNQFSGEVRGKQTKGPTVKHRSVVDDSSDDEDSWVDQDTGGATEEGDPTDGLREAVETTTRRLRNSNSTSVAIATHTSTLPETVHGPGPSADSSRHINSHSTPGNVNINETGLSSENAARVDQDIHIDEANLSTEDAARIKVLAQCVKNWKAAAEDDKKRMWAIFDEAGVFACACRHGFVLWILDMIRSGELYVEVPLFVLSLFANSGIKL